LGRQSLSAAYRTIAIACAVFFAAGLTLASLGPSLPALALRLGVESAALGGLFTAFSIGVIATQFVVGRFWQRFGQRATLAAGMALMGLGELAIAQANALPLIFAAALVGGAGFGSVMATGNTLVAQLFPKASAAALNGTNLFFGVGAIAGPSLVAALSSRFGAPQLALVVGASALMVLAPIVLTAAADGTSSAAREQIDTRAALPTRSWMLGWLLLVYTGTEIGVGAWLTLYMSNSGTLDTTRAALAVAAFWLALTGGRALAAAIGIRVRAHSLLWLCLAGLLVGAILFALGIGNVPITIAAVLIFGLACGPVFPTVLALVASGADSGPATSRVLVLANCGGMLLPALLGLVLARFGPSAATAQLVVAGIVMIGLGAAAMRPVQLATRPAEADCAPAC
jgi:fucose permease